jgi:uncharacterized protein
MLRTSSYTIYASLPDDDENMLLIHGYSGAYDKVSRKVAEYLLSLEAGPPPVPLHGQWVSDPALSRGSVTEAPSDQTIATLTRRGYLTTLSVSDEERRVAKLIKTRHARALEKAPGYLFMPTYDCNLRCAYCFQNHMRTRPELRPLLRLMSTEMVDRICAALPFIERNHGIEEGSDHDRVVGFFGGEPLLAASRSIVEYVMATMRDLGRTRFWAVSNATELEAYTALLGPDGIANIQITLDGPPDQHDLRRVYADGSGSFGKIAQNIDRCLALGVKVSVRVNLDTTNIDAVPRLADTIVGRGWDRSPLFSVYAAPITPNENKSLDDTFRSRWELDQALDALRVTFPEMRVIGRPDDGLQAVVRRMFDDGHAVPQFKTSFCGAHTGMYIFDAFGDIYACWERTGDARVRIGRVLDGGTVELHEAQVRLWHSRTPASNPTCRKCRYAFQCGGGCAVLAEGQNGKFHSNYCDGFATRFRHSVAAAYQDHLSGVEVRAPEIVCDL